MFQRVMLLGALCLLATCLQATEKGYRLYNVVPMLLGREGEQSAQCIALQKRADVDLALYSLTLHPEGKPAIDKVNRYLASYDAFAQALKGSPVRVGILVQAILGHWPRTDKDVEPWMRTIDQDGRRVRFCPLDPGFADYITYVFTEIAKRHPAFILTDDDVRAYSHGAECFCARHVEAFNKLRGTHYDSEALRNAVARGAPGVPDYDCFMRMQRDMMENAVVGRIRNAIDAVDPTIPAGICIASEEHYFVAPMARRIAGRGQTPVMRCSTGSYAERMTASAFPPNFLRMIGFAQMYADSDIALLDEADTCPQNLWSKSACGFYTHLLTSCFAGMSGAKTWYVDGIRASGIPVTRAYGTVLARHRGQLDALVRLREGSKMRGLAVPCFKKMRFWHAVKDHNEFFTQGEACMRAVMPFGIPVSTSSALGDPAQPFILGDASEVARLTDAELDELFAGRVLVLSDAALALTKRGKANLTGVSARQDNALLFNGEWDCRQNCSLPNSSTLDGRIRLTPVAGNRALQSLTELYFSPYAGAPRTEVAPGTLWVCNALGGEVIVTVWNHHFSSLHQFSEQRKAWLMACVDKLSSVKLAFCGNDQDVLMAERQCTDGKRLILVVNLNADPVDVLRLRVLEKGSLAWLDPTGKCVPLVGAFDGKFCNYTLPRAIGFYDSAVFVHTTP